MIVEIAISTARIEGFRTHIRRERAGQSLNDSDCLNISCQSFFIAPQTFQGQSQTVQRIGCMGAQTQVAPNGQSFAQMLFGRLERFAALLALSSSQRAQDRGRLRTRSEGTRNLKSVF